MKKILVITVVMLFACGTMAGAYVLAGSAKNAANMKYMTSLQFGDNTNASSPQPAAVDGTVELALPSNQDWCPPGDKPTWYYKILRKPGPEPFQWKIALWGNNFADETAHVRFWVQAVGDDGTLGRNIKDLGLMFKNCTTGEILWTGTVAGTSTEAAPLIDLWLPVVNTVTPEIDGGCYTLGLVPEPGSILALLTGLVGIVGIRRRK